MIRRARGSVASEQDVDIEVAGARLKGHLHLPGSPTGLVIFAHGSGSSRRSPRNLYVAEVLQEFHLASLLIDLLSEEEERIDRQTRELRFDIKLLADRLIEIANWCHALDKLQALRIGFFGASTGGGAALMAAARVPHKIQAVVSRGGRPDLAQAFLPRVKAPTLLIVGELDLEVLRLNERALQSLGKTSQLNIVPQATHLFPENGALETVAHLAGNWFRKHLASEEYSRFKNREDAGVKLAAAIAMNAGKHDMALAMPRGGVPVAFEVANALNLKLDLLLVRKLGVPGHEELAMGAIAQGGIQVLNQDIIDQLKIPDAAIEEVRRREEAELERRNQRYRGSKAAPRIDGRAILLIDDGLATGASMKAAISALRAAKAGRITVAVPVGARITLDELEPLADQVICPLTPDPFFGVGRWYDDFAQTTDLEVSELLAKAEERQDADRREHKPSAPGKEQTP